MAQSKARHYGTVVFIAIIAFGAGYGLKQLRDFVKDYGIDFGPSLFRREIAIRLVNGQNLRITCWL
jgi:hypothetical protein